MIIIIYLNQFLNEDYYGKNKNLEQCEVILKNIRDKILKNKNINVNESNENKELCRIIKDEFGFKNVYISWLYLGVPNACTYPVSLTLSSFDEELIKTDKEIKFNNSDMTLIINLYYELFTIADMTASEVMSILLHEIGHNFQHRSANSSSLYYMQAVNLLINAIINLMQGDPSTLIQYFLYGTNQGRIATGKINSSRFNFIMSKISAFFNSIILSLRSLLKFIPFVDLVGAIALLPLAGLKIIIKWVSKLLGGIGDIQYFGEKYSDNFVTSYGYGPELISSMKKFEQYGSDPVNRLVNKSPFLREYVDFMSLPLRYINLLFDPHPSTIYRVKDQIKMLEAEFNKSGISKEAKKALSDDLFRAKKEIDVFEDKAKSIKEFGKVRTAFNAFLIKSYGGDPKEVIDKTESYDYNEQ